MKERIAVVLGLLFFLFVPIWYSPEFTFGLFSVALGIAGYEWMSCLATSPIVDRRAYGSIILCFCGLFLWAIPGGLLLNSAILGSCPGHTKTFEAILVVMLVSDSAQLLSGTLVGKSKCFPSISPNKTLEGYAGGLIIAVVYAMMVHKWFFIHSLYAVLAGMFGDLYFSYFKRVMEVKDYGSLLGAHGGVCDRIDAFVFGWGILTWMCSNT